MPVIGWNESVPSNSSYVRDFPKFMQSVTTSMAAALGTNALYWTPTSGSAASVGEMQPGGSRTLVTAASALSNADNATFGQRLHTTSDTTRLYCHDSLGTWRVGTPYFVEPVVGPAYGSTDHSMYTSQWLFQSGSQAAAIGSSYSITVTFPVAYTRRPPSITYGLGGSSIAVEFQVSLSTVTTGGAIFHIWPTPGYAPASNPTLYWTSVGTVGGLV